MLGGSALLTLMELNGQKFRPTLDMDINIINATDEEGFAEQLKKHNIDIVGGIMEVPPLEDLEKKNLYELRNDFESIRIYLPKLELLACCKIFSSRGKDLEDLERFKILEYCNKEKLMAMIEEYKENLLNPSNPNLNLYQLERIFKEKGI